MTNVPVPSHSIIEWYGLEGTFKIFTFPAAIGRDTSHYTRLLEAPSSLVYGASREDASTTSVGNLL